jgi:hypothetical protein
MKGGALPLLAWGALIGALWAINWIWTGDTLQVGTYGFAVGLILAWGAMYVLGSRTTARRGPPEPSTQAEAVPQSSLGALLLGCAVAMAGFGLVFGTFLVLMGAGVFVGAAGLMTRELIAQRRALRDARTRRGMERTR